LPDVADRAFGGFADRAFGGLSEPNNQSLLESLHSNFSRYTLIKEEISDRFGQMDCPDSERETAVADVTTREAEELEDSLNNRSKNPYRSSHSFVSVLTGCGPHDLMVPICLSVFVYDTGSGFVMSNLQVH